MTIIITVVDANTTAAFMQHNAGVCLQQLTDTVAKIAFSY